MTTYTVLADLRREEATELSVRMTSWFGYRFTWEYRYAGEGSKLTFFVTIESTDKFTKKTTDIWTAWAQGFVNGMHLGKGV